MGKRKTAAVTPSASRMIDLGGPVSDRVQIRHIILAETVARRQALCVGPPAELAVNVDVTTEARKQELIVQVFPRFTLIGRGKTDGDEEMLRIEALFVVQYHVPSFDGITKENIDAFGQMNGVYNAWPYWREFVQSMTVRMGLPPLTVPVFRSIDVDASRRAKVVATPAATSPRQP